MRNHHILSREQFAEASTLAEAGEIRLARNHLLFAAEHALSQLAARHMVELTHADVRRDRVTAAVRLAEIGAAPAEVAPVLRDLDDEELYVALDDGLAARLAAARLGASFGPVQALIDTSRRNVERPAEARSPLSTGPRGALNTRGAESVVRAVRSLNRRPVPSAPALGFTAGRSIDSRGADAAGRALSRFGRWLTRPAGVPFSGRLRAL